MNSLTYKEYTFTNFRKTRLGHHVYFDVRKKKKVTNVDLDKIRIILDQVINLLGEDGKHYSYTLEFEKGAVRNALASIHLSYEEDVEGEEFSTQKVKAALEEATNN